MRKALKDGMPDVPDWARRVRRVDVSNPMTLWLLALTAAAFALRYIGIASESLWADEIHSVVTGRRSLGTIFGDPIGNNQPLYFAIVHFWIQVFGENETSLRFPSLLFGVLTVPMTYLLATRFTDRLGALGAAVLTTLAPVLVWYSQENRMYSLTTLLLVVSTYFLVVFLQEGRRRYVVFYAVAAFLGLYTHYYFAPFIAMHNLVAIAWLLRAGTRRSLVGWLLAQFAVSVAIVSRIPILVNDLSTGIDNLATGRSTVFLWDAVEVVGLGDISSAGNASIMALMWAAIIAGVIFAVRNRSPIVMLALFAGISLLLLALGREVFDLPVKLRYAVPTIPLWFVLAGYGFTQAVRHLPRPNPRVARAVATGIVAIAALAVLIGTLGTWREQLNGAEKQQWREVAELMHTVGERSDIVHTYPRGLKSLEYYLEQSPFDFVVRPDGLPTCSEGRKVWVIQTRQSAPLNREGQRAIDALTKEKCEVLIRNEYSGNISVYVFAPKPGTQSVLVASRCGDLEPTILGTGGDDVINGTSGDDVISGLGGDDRIFGRGGNDVLCGGPGDDELFGGPGNDTLFGGPGADRLRGNEGDDRLDGGVDNDVLWGNEDNDVILGGNGNDRLNGNDGDDLLNGGNGRDIIDGGAGYDVLAGDNGNDILRGGTEDDILSGGTGNDNMSGGEGQDILDGNDGDDLLDGGPGDDQLTGGADLDTFIGGDGLDRCLDRTSGESVESCEQ